MRFSATSMTKVYAYAKTRRDFLLASDDTLWAHESHGWLLKAVTGAQVAHRVGDTTTTRRRRNRSTSRRPNLRSEGGGSAILRDRVPYISPSGSAISSRRSPSGPWKYIDDPLMTSYGQARRRTSPAGVPSAPARWRSRCGAARRAPRRTHEIEPGEIEEGEEIAVADVEEEVRRPLVVAVLEELGQRELEQALIERDRLLDVARDSAMWWTPRADDGARARPA